MNRKNMAWFVSSLMITGMSALRGWAEESAAVRVGSILSLGTVTPYVAREIDAFHDAGLDVELYEFSDGSALMEAFAAGELDLAYVGVGPAAAWYDKGLELKVVAGANGGGHAVMTRTDTGIESIEGLKDKLVAEPNPATVTDLMLRAEILAGAELSPEMDVILIPGMKPADMSSSLMATKEVDAIITWEPYVSQALDEYGEDIRIIYDAAAVLSDEQGEFYPGNALIASGSFMEEAPRLLETYLRVHEDVTEYINTEEEADEVMAELLSLDKDVIESARERVCFSNRIDREGIEKILQWSVDLGYLSELPDESFYME